MNKFREVHRVKLALCRFTYASVLSCMVSLLTGVNADQGYLEQHANIETSRFLPLIGDELPSDNNGQCYSRHTVPAQFRDEWVDVVLREPSSEFKITPAQLKSQRAEVLRSEAYVEVVSVEPQIVAQKREFELDPATTRWVRGTLDGKIPMSEGDRRDVQAAGVKLNEVDAGTCLYEYLAPATYKETAEKILISESFDKLSVKPATFKNSKEPLLVQPEHQRLVEVPAVFRTVEQRVLIEASRTRWKKGPGLDQRIDEASGELVHRVHTPANYEFVSTDVVEVPAMITSITVPAKIEEIAVKRLDKAAEEVREPVDAVYEDVYRQSIDKPATFDWLNSANAQSKNGAVPTGRALCHQHVPAKIHKFTRQLVMSPGHFERIPQAAQFDTMEVVELQADARSETVAVAARTDRVATRVLVKDAYDEWHPALCKSAMNKTVVRNIQRALKNKGFSPGPIDGVLGRGTHGAVEEFQKASSLAPAGLTLHTLSKLGLDISKYSYSKPRSRSR